MYIEISVSHNNLRSEDTIHEPRSNHRFVFYLQLAYLTIEEKVQTFVALVASIIEVIRLFMSSHALPLAPLRLISVGIIALGKSICKDSPRRDTNQVLVSTMIEWLVILPINVGRRNARQLDGDIV